MARTYQTFQLEDVDKIKRQMLSWSSQFNICCFLDNQQYGSAYHSYECIAGVGAVAVFDSGSGLDPELPEFLTAHGDWTFGHFNFETIGRDGEPAGTVMVAEDFPVYLVFVPATVLLLQGNELIIGTLQQPPVEVMAQIVKETITSPSPAYDLTFTPHFSRAEYLDTVRQLLKHIYRGDCYEINFCQQFTTNAAINPVSVYADLTKVSPNPFSAFYRNGDNYLMCASPERYLKKGGDKIISQPIKGTSARSNDLLQDQANKTGLRESKKERSENVMIVDLVRNDLSKICREGTVVGEELFGIYSFPHVHQMISTVTGILREDINFAAILNATFPMGSMTGAPKNRVLELIKQYEKGQRGIYSGTMGYFTPDGDFDFNVVIRSIVYNDKQQRISFHVGSAITASSDPETEYEECLLKGKAILQLFSSSSGG